MSRILQGMLNEANIPDPSYLTDPEEYAARGRPRIKNYIDPDDHMDNPYDDVYKQQDRERALYDKEVTKDWQSQEGKAPNGERYNSILTIKAANSWQPANELRKFEDAHWGAKKVVDTVDIEPNHAGEPYTKVVYFIDNHKYGMWTPFKGENPIGKTLEFESLMMQEGISQEDLAERIFDRLEMRYPDVVSRYGHEVVGDAVMDTANLHAGAEELGTSDIGQMVREVIRSLEGIGNDLDESSFPFDVQRMMEGFPYDVDHMPGPTKNQENTNCTKCHGRKSMYKLDGKLFADNKKGATKVKCPTCKGTGDKQGVNEAKKNDVGMWRVEQSEATGRYYVVQGYYKTRKIWKNKLGAIDFNSKEDAQEKADELNKGVAEGFSDIVKGVKRAVKGKEHPDVVAAKHAGRAMGHYNQGDIVAGDKEANRYVKTRDMHLKAKGVAEGRDFSGRKAEAEQMKRQGYPDSSVYAAMADYHQHLAKKYKKTNPEKSKHHLQQHLSFLDKMDSADSSGLNKDVAESSESKYTVTIDAIDHGVLVPITVSAVSEKEAKQKAITRVKADMMKRGYELVVRGVKVKSLQGVAEGSEDQGTKMNKTCSRCGGSLFRFPNTIKCHKCNQTWKASPKNKEQGVAEDWQKVNKKDKTDGMSSKAVKAYRRENPGSKLKTAVTTKPSKLKKGSKDAKRRKSFCARMSGMKKAHASAKTKRDPNSPINKALRRWNCESIEELQELVMIAEQKIKEKKEDPCWDNYKQIGMKIKNGKKVPNCVPKESVVNELSTNKLAKYKTNAAADAIDADKKGDTERANKRFRGVVKATNKQFANDAKKTVKESAMLQGIKNVNR